VEFVCGDRALKVARRDFETLTQAGALFSSGLYEVPQNIRKSLDEIKSAQRQQHKLFEELAELSSDRMLASASEKNNRKLVKQVFADRDVAFVKLLAQKLSKHAGMIALLGTWLGQPTVILARAADVELDVGAIMKEALASVGGRGGGSKDLAQGGAPDAAKLAELVDSLETRITG
jgi:alanyl-tRNA synthetase